MAEHVDNPRAAFSPAGPAPTLEVRRTIRAPRQRVFDARTKAEELTRWHAPAPASVDVAEVDLRVGQKTGLYLDQRENRLAIAKYLKGRRVLDMFCYTGGFALSALALGGAREVLAIDTSAKAIATAEANASLNGIAGARFETDDGFQALDRLLAMGERFDAVILDPPKFARSRHAATDALRAYHRINRLACELLTPGGILVTCSCSGHVTREDFLYMLVGVAQQTKRDLQILETRGAAADHPVSATCVETEYLKCFICRVL